jgi:hypothetical protein
MITRASAGNSLTTVPLQIRSTDPVQPDRSVAAAG